MRCCIPSTAGWISLAVLGVCALAPLARSQDLTIVSTHTGTFQFGQTNAYYILRVNNIGAAPTSGFVSAAENPPPDLTITSMLGDGWSCTANSCGRSDALAPGASYPAILVVASLALNTSPILTNHATVSGGGETDPANNTTSDAAAVVANGYPVAWGNNELGQATVPAGLSNVVALAGGDYHSLALKADGTLVAWGGNWAGQSTVPAALSSVVAIAAGWGHSLALRSDGTVVAWGDNLDGQTNVPAGLSGVIGIAAGAYFSLALKSDGTVVGWGDNTYGQTAVPPSLSKVLTVVSGLYHSLALKSDGTVVAWSDITSDPAAVPKGLSHVIGIAAYGSHSLALGSDGKVVAWGNNSRGQSSVPAGLSGVVSIAAGFFHSLALQSDGTVVAWGDNSSGESSVPPGLSNVVSIAGGGSHSLALVSVAPLLMPTTIVVSAPNGPVTVDGASYSQRSLVFNWTPGSSHSIGTTSPVTIDSNSRYVFVSWSDGGAISHTVTPITATTYTANFKLQYLLTASANPPAGGAITPASGFLDAGSTLQVTAKPSPGYTFAGFSGGLTGTINPQSLTIWAARTVTASFAPVMVSAALRFIPVTACRVLDTRKPEGPFSGPAITAQTSRDFAIPDSSCNIPATAQAYSLNVTVVPTGPLGYLTIWPTGQAKPLASTLNSLDGRIKANAAIVPAGTAGAVSVFASSTTQVVLDIDGYFVAATDPSALAFYPLTPCRISDSRHANGPLGGPLLQAGTSRTVSILSSSCGVPASARAYSLNITAVPTGSLGYVTTWPTGQAKPRVSTLNAPTGAITANAAIVPAGAGGAIDVFASSDTHLVVDINGYFAPIAAGGLSLYTLPPCRVMDSRKPVGSLALTAGVPLDVDVIDSGCGAPLAVQAYVLNATVVPTPAGLGYLTLWQQGAGKPVVSTLNALDGEITSNMAIVPTTNGSISAFPSSPTHVVLDIAAYFAP